MKKIGSLTLYIISIIFILSGALNFGFSRFMMAVPFMIVAAWLSKKKFKSRGLFVGTLLLCAATIVVNLTLEKNPMMFPILDDGIITINQDGYLQTHSKNIGHFTLTDKDEFACTGCGPTKYKPLSKGAKIKVTGIIVEHPDFGTSLRLLTEAGPFAYNGTGNPLSLIGYGNNEYITPNKPVVSPVLEHGGDLMYYPVAFFFAKDKLNALIPGTKVLVEDDAGKIREGTLGRSVTSGRPVSSGDKVRLNCVNAKPSPQGKLCKLEFFGVDRSSPYPKGNALYGTIPDFSITIDASGAPDKNVLVYK